MSQTAQMLPGSLGLRRPMPDLGHHRQDLALVLASRVEAHNHQRKQGEPLELCQDTPGLVEREGLPILLDLQLLLRRVPVQVGHVVVLAQDQHLLSILDALLRGRAGLQAVDEDVEDVLQHHGAQGEVDRLWFALRHVCDTW